MRFAKAGVKAVHFASPPLLATLIMPFVLVVAAAVAFSFQPEVPAEQSSSLLMFVACHVASEPDLPPSYLNSLEVNEDELPFTPGAE